LTDVIKEQLIADMMAGSQSSDITHKDPRAQREGHVKRTKKEAQHARITQQTQHQHEIRVMEAKVHTTAQENACCILNIETMNERTLKAQATQPQRQESSRQHASSSHVRTLTAQH